MELNDIGDAHNAYLTAWHDALRTGDAASVQRFLAPAHHGWFATAAADEMAFDRSAAIDGVQQSVAALRGSQMIIQRRAINPRGTHEAVVTYEKKLTNEREVIACALIVEAWYRHTHGWMLQRELTEHSVEPSNGSSMPSSADPTAIDDR